MEVKTDFDYRSYVSVFIQGIKFAPQAIRQEKEGDIEDRSTNEDEAYKFCTYDLRQIENVAKRDFLVYVDKISFSANCLGEAISVGYLLLRKDESLNIGVLTRFRSILPTAGRQADQFLQISTGQ